jgi:hypothetical protein
VFAIVLSGTKADGEPFSTQVSNLYKTKRGATRAATKMLRATAGVGKIADSFEVIEPEIMAVETEHPASLATNPSLDSR